MKKIRDMLNRLGPEIERYQQITGLIILQGYSSFATWGMAGSGKGMPGMTACLVSRAGPAGCLLLPRIKGFGNLIHRWGRLKYSLNLGSLGLQPAGQGKMYCVRFVYLPFNR